MFANVVACSTKSEFVVDAGRHTDAHPHADAGVSPDGATSTPDAATDAATSTPDANVSAPDASVAKSDLELLNELVAALPTATNDTARRKLVSAFTTAVTYGERGFPIREGGMLAFALYDTDGGSFTVAGDFNGWDAAAWPLSQPVAGFPFYYRIQPVSEPLPRTLYKFVHNGADWFADPIARRRGWDGYGPYSLAEAGDAQSHIERWPDFAQGVGALQPRNVDIYVPAAYQKGTATLPVLYMHDGQNLFDPEGLWGSWQVGTTADEKIGSGAAAPVLIVGVWNTSDRMDEYTQVADDIGGGTLVGGRANEYADFLVKGVKPFVDARYRTKADRASTAVLGSSLGGIVSFYAAWRYPDIFGHSGSMSGTFGWGSWGTSSNMTLMHMFMAMPPSGVVFYLDSGGDAGAGCPNGGGDNYCETVDMADALRGLGWKDGVDLLYAWAPGAQHNEAEWAARFPALLADWY